ncbi:DUF4232 domain-containing protein [Streptomyces sp. NPDC050617]|uniref:DUF4232 domain-containing protein n=1 Tax=Streptomyces sp. NPDC050617 TaxID=3154628 RepID=UPI00343DD4DB
MRTVPLALPAAAAVAGALLLTACGSQKAGSDSPGDGSAHAGGAGSAGRSSASPCGVRPSGATATATPPAPTGDPSKLKKDGVEITAMGGGTEACADFTVTNHESQALTYTITFTFVSEAGEALTNTEKTVPSVKPGQTVKGTVIADGRLPDGGPHPGARGDARARITSVRSVPADEAPSKGGACPASGVRVYADDGDAAMGLRAVSIHLENCGDRISRLNGYPQLQLLDAAHKPVDSVEVLHGGSAISTGTGADGAPRPLALKPGERAYAVLVWRNTVESGDPVNAPYVRLRVKPGADPVMVTPELDLGTTGKLGIGPWKKDETQRPSNDDGASGARSPESPRLPGTPDRPRP